MKILTLVLLLLIHSPAYPADEQDGQERFHFWGSYKNLFTDSKTPVMEESFWSDLNRLRLGLDVDIAPKVRFSTVWDNEILVGTLLDRAEFGQVKNSNTNTLLDLDHLVVDSDDILWRTNVYRMFLKISMEHSNVILGRQRIAWGTGRLWNPVDLFNPVSPLQIERNQREGVDAVNLEYFSGALSSLTFVHAAGDEREDDSTAIRAVTNVNGYDLAFTAGEFREDKVVGFEFNGNLGESGFRGEFTYTDADSARDFWRGVLSWDRSFTDKLYLLLEYLYNGGNIDSLDTAVAAGLSPTTNQRRFSGEIITKNENFLGALASYEITPLWRASSLLVVDIDGGSSFLGPSVKYNVLADLDWILGAQIFTGDSKSEYGNLSNVWYTSLEWFF